MLEPNTTVMRKEEKAWLRLQEGEQHMTGAGGLPGALLVRGSEVRSEQLQVFTGPRNLDFTPQTRSKAWKGARFAFGKNYFRTPRGTRLEAGRSGKSPR